MRQLTLEEKKIINEMYVINNNSRFICNALPLFLKNEEIHIDKDTNEISIISGYESETDFLKFYSDDIVDKRMLTLEKNIVVLVNLLKMLEQDGYIFLYRMVITDFHEDVIGICKGLVKASKPIKDTRLCQTIIDFIDFSVITTPSLDDLRSHHFISIDDRKYKKSQNIAVIAIVISFIIGIFPTVINYYFDNTQNKIIKLLQEIKNKKYDDKFDQIIDEIQKSEYIDKLNEIILELKKIEKEKS